MFKRQDPYTYTQFFELLKNSKPLGLLALEYRVALYNDVEVQNQSSVTHPTDQQFFLYCTQRVFLQNPYVTVGPITGPTAQYFADYPALIEAFMQVERSTGVRFDLLDYSPQTVNTVVQQSGSTANSQSQTSGTSTSSTSGSSYSQSSTYGMNVTVGDSFSGLSQSGEFSSSSTTESSKTTGSEASASASAERSSGASMSIKDWGSYAWVNPEFINPTWVFGQEYPWNAIDCRFAGHSTYPGVGVWSDPNPNQHQLIVSKDMMANLYDGTILYPPSELSMYGLNFVMKCCWRVYVDYTASTTVSIQHLVDYFSGSHLVHNGCACVYLDKVASQLFEKRISIDLNIMGLDPLGVNTRAAIVGFLPSKFIPPCNGDLPQAFKTLAATNDLMIENSSSYGEAQSSGFSVSQACLTAAWSASQAVPYQLTLYFKVTDSVSEYTLNIKHWMTGAPGVQLSIVINGDASNTITRYVTDQEGEGGDDNILTLALRDLDFAAIDYHDYLQLGLNSIAITMAPIDNNWTSNCTYEIRAMSITQGS